MKYLNIEIIILLLVFGLSLVLGGCGQDPHTPDRGPKPCPCRNFQACASWDGFEVTSGLLCILN